MTPDPGIFDTQSHVVRIIPGSDTISLDLDIAGAMGMRANQNQPDDSQDDDSTNKEDVIKQVLPVQLDKMTHSR